MKGEFVTVEDSHRVPVLFGTAKEEDWAVLIAPNPFKCERSPRKGVALGPLVQGGRGQEAAPECWSQFWLRNVGLVSRRFFGRWTV